MRAIVNHHRHPAYRAHNGGYIDSVEKCQRLDIMDGVDMLISASSDYVQNGKPVHEGLPRWEDEAANIIAFLGASPDVLRAIKEQRSLGNVIKYCARRKGASPFVKVLFDGSPVASEFDEWLNKEYREFLRSH